MKLGFREAFWGLVQIAVIVGLVALTWWFIKMAALSILGR